VAEELGTWPPEQATVLLEVLQKAGLSPQAKRTRDGVVVTVSEDESDEAHRQLVANMDTIARAARQQRPSGPRTGSRRPRAVKGADNQDSSDRQRALASERMNKLARPIGIALVALLVLLVVGRFNAILAIMAVGALVYVIGKRAQERGDGDSPNDGRR
jgi:Flp pilus assembly protein TadB